MEGSDGAGAARIQPDPARPLANGVDRYANVIHCSVNMVHVITRSTPRQQKREVTFDRIVDAAMRTVSAQGMDALTMQGLAADLGFAVGALYRYFPGKDAIVVAVQRRIVEAVGEELSAALSIIDARAASRVGELTERDAALLRLWVVVRVYQAMARTRPTEFGLLGLTMGDPRQLVQDAHAGELIPALAALLQQVGALFAAAASCGALGDGDAARRTLVLWTSVQGALQLRKLERFQVGGLDAGAVLDEAVATLLLGCGANAARSDAMKRRAHRLLGSLPRSKG